MTWPAPVVSPVSAPALSETRARDNNRRDLERAVTGVYYANYQTWRSSDVAGPMGLSGLRPRPVGDRSQRPQPERPRGPGNGRLLHQFISPRAYCLFPVGVLIWLIVF